MAAAVAVDRQFPFQPHLSQPMVNPRGLLINTMAKLRLEFALVRFFHWKQGDVCSRGSEGCEESRDIGCTPLISGRHRWKNHAVVALLRQPLGWLPCWSSELRVVLARMMRNQSKKRLQ